MWKDGCCWIARLFGRFSEKGCQPPDRKCRRDPYKETLIQAIRDNDVEPPLGGIEYAKDIVKAICLERAVRADRSLKQFLDDLRRALR
ncbi:hypothetical protein MAMC_00336 [Methylacidimicrobium cyclopophantes]|uniref:Uncharacterized protein n=1 Tax=Methylacidimicrobium cyclopophantes TaxID=1041766 RepID=A0A5E6MB35_9BACT|nr:hypothetical protein [Methylacidimicrobium cyclopophantes]VVM04965.1 hypothetical protein MAMC_00336 [Methylacidimicrobium cyclopophantes]